MTRFNKKCRAGRIYELARQHNTRLLRYESYRRNPRPETDRWEWEYIKTIPEDESTSCGDLHEVKLGEFVERAWGPDGLYLEVPHSSGGDYSGSTVEKANHKEFMAQFGELPWVHEYHGGYGTYGVVVNVKEWIASDDESSAESMIEIFEGLEDYPLINEEALSLLEMELSDEAWDSWGQSDFRQALENDCEFVDIEIVDAGKFRQFFEAAREAVNVYWESVGPDMCVRIERVMEAITADEDGFAIATKYNNSSESFSYAVAGVNVELAPVEDKE